METGHYGNGLAGNVNEMDFKKFLDEKHFAGVIKYVDLGEWAWEQLKDTDEIEMYLDELPSNANYYINKKSISEFADKGDYICIYWEIAIACLGLQEVKKRLRKF